MEEKRIAAIKLVSGEEIICTLIEIEKDGIYTNLLFQDPARIVTRDRRKSKRFSLEPWLYVKNDSLQLIELSKIITVHRVTEVDILNEYASFTRKKLDLKPKPKRSNNSTKLGYVGNVDDFKSVLEKLYKDTDAYKRPNDI